MTPRQKLPLPDEQEPVKGGSNMMPVAYIVAAILGGGGVNYGLNYASPSTMTEPRVREVVREEIKAANHADKTDVAVIQVEIKQLGESSKKQEKALEDIQKLLLELIRK